MRDIIGAALGLDRVTLGLRGSLRKRGRDVHEKRRHQQRSKRCRTCQRVDHLNKSLSLSLQPPLQQNEIMNEPAKNQVRHHFRFPVSLQVVCCYFYRMPS